MTRRVVLASLGTALPNFDTQRSICRTIGPDRRSTDFQRNAPDEHTFPGPPRSRMVTVRPPYASDGDTVHREHAVVSHTIQEDHAPAPPGHISTGAADGRSPTNSASRPSRRLPVIT